MDWLRNLVTGGPETPEVVAAKKKIEEAQAELDAAKNAAANPPQGTSDLSGVNPPASGGRRRKTKRSKKSKSKRSRTGRKSNRL
jgi:hypothetical protein